MSETADLKAMVIDLNARGVTPYKLVQILVMRGIKVQFVQVQRILNDKGCSDTLGQAIRDLHAAHTALENAAENASRETPLGPACNLNP